MSYFQTTFYTLAGIRRYAIIAAYPQIRGLSDIGLKDPAVVRIDDPPAELLTDARFPQVAAPTQRPLAVIDRQLMVRANMPCKHRGAILKPSVRCGVGPLYKCEVYGECTRSKCDDVQHNCRDCLSYADPWLEKLKDLEIPPAPACAGEGYVFVGGGKFWPGVVVAVKMLRRFDSVRPIQVWHQKTEIVDPGQLAGLGVTFHLTDPQPKRDPGWTQKLTAIRGCGFKRLCYLDADAYLIADPQPYWDELKIAPFVFYEDSHDNHVKWDEVWPEGPKTKGVQGGQLWLDREQAWPLIATADWLCRNSAHYFSRMFGDQDTWRVALAIHDIPYRMFAKKFNPLVGGSYVYSTADGVQRIVHRCNRKMFREEDCPKDKPDYGKRFDGFPSEETAWRCFQEAVAPPFPLTGSADDYIYREVVLRNEYGLPDDLSGQTVLDIGGHVGIFAYAALGRGATVRSYEPDPNNFQRLLAHHGSNPRFVGINAPVWGEAVSLAYQADPANNGGGKCVPGDGSQAVAFDEILKEMGRVDLLKIDAEGAEWPIFRTTQALDRVGRIVGEIHGGDVSEFSAMLQAAGFAVSVRTPEAGQGIFIAERSA